MKFGKLALPDSNGAAGVFISSTSLRAKVPRTNDWILMAASSSSFVAQSIEREKQTNILKQC